MHENPRGRAPWIALAALTVLLVGVGIAARMSMRPAPAPPAPAPAVVDVIHEPPEPDAPDSVAIKHRWLDDVAGLDLGTLPPGRREVFLRHANAQECTCGCGYTLAGCRASDMSCDISGPRLEALLDSVRTGRITGAAGLRERPPGGG